MKKREMKKVQKYELIQPKTGQTHRLFGTKYLKRHKMRDPLWTADHKIAQYSGVAKLYERDLQLNQLKNTLEGENNKKLLAKLKDEVKEIEKIPEMEKQKDRQKLKNMMHHDKYMQRYYPNVDPTRITERIETRTFTKQRNLDKLKFKQKQLLEKYRSRLYDVAFLQDRIKFRDSIEPKDFNEIRHLQVEITNAETRLRALGKVERTYKKVIEYMKLDAIFYNSLIDALEDDLEEQEMLLEKTKLLGIPALQILNELTTEFDNIEKKNEQDSSDRRRDLMERKKYLTELPKKYFDFIRRDDDFTIDPTRYNRDTKEITKAKEQLEQLQPLIKQLKLATFACQPKEIYANMKMQEKKSKRVMTHLKRSEKEEKVVEKRLLHADVITEKLTYNQTPDEIENLKQIKESEQLEEEIKEGRKSVKEEIFNVQSQFMVIRTAFQHVNDVLKNIGQPLIPGVRPRTSALGLPLLNFSAAYKKMKPIEPFEEDLEKLFKTAKAKVTEVARKYKAAKQKKEADEKKILENNVKAADTKWKKEEADKKLKELREKNQEKILTLEETTARVKAGHEKLLKENEFREWKDLHNAICKQFESQYANNGNNKKFNDVAIDERFAREDPSIPTRMKIKEMSAKLVEKMSKIED